MLGVDGKYLLRCIEQFCNVCVAFGLQDFFGGAVTLQANKVDHGAEPASSWPELAIENPGIWTEKLKRKEREGLKFGTSIGLGRTKEISLLLCLPPKRKVSWWLVGFSKKGQLVASWLLRRTRFSHPHLSSMFLLIKEQQRCSLNLHFKELWPQEKKALQALPEWLAGH